MVDFPDDPVCPTQEPREAWVYPELMESQEHRARKEMPDLPDRTESQETPVELVLPDFEETQELLETTVCQDLLEAREKTDEQPRDVMVCPELRESEAETVPTDVTETQAHQDSPEPLERRETVESQEHQELEL